MRLNTSNIITYAILTLSSLELVSGAVMSIDFGTEWIKIGLVKPSVPFDIVLNRDSKRKTQAILTIRGTERTYSVNGQALGVRFPKDAYSDLKWLAGKPFNSNQTQQYIATHWNRISKDEKREVPVFVTDIDQKYSVEELIAMLFQYARTEAETTANEKIKDVVITVPPYFNQFERQSILDAAQIADLNALSLINDGSAVAINYAMTRKFPSGPQHHIIYDIGSGSAAATLVRIQDTSAKEGKYKRKTNFTLIEVLSTGYDETLGGKAFDQKLVEILINRFKEKYPDAKDIWKSPKAISKLVKDGNKMKLILSANKDATLWIESLHEDLDFKTVISRNDFEDASNDLFSRTLNPIHDALSNANMKIDQIDSIILVGGGVRIPKIQESLLSFAGEKRISQSVNGDESAAIGATFFGASLSSQFKVKDIRLKESTPFKIEAVINPVKDELSKEKTTISLISPHAPTYEHKFFTLKFASDFDFVLKYPHDSSVKETYGCSEIGQGTVRGIDKALEEYKDRLVEEPKARIMASISNSGILSFSKAQLLLQLKALEQPSKTPDDVNNTKSGENSTESGDSKEKESKKTVSEKIYVKLDFKHTCFPPMTKKAIDEAKERLTKLNNLDQERYARDEALNNLESFIYSNDDYVEDEEVIQLTTSDEREKLVNAVTKISEWLNDNGSASKKELVQKYNELLKLKEPIDVRLKEYSERPKAAESLKETIDSIGTYGETLLQNLTSQNKEALVPILEEMKSKASEISNWLEEKLSKQANVKPYESPVVTALEIEAKHRELDDFKYKLVAKILELPKEKPSTTKEKSESSDSPLEDKIPKDEETAESIKDGGKPSSTEGTSEKNTTEDEHDEL